MKANWGLRWWLELAASQRACPWKFHFHGEIYLCWQTVLMRHNGGVKLLIPDGAFFFFTEMLFSVLFSVSRDRWRFETKLSGLFFVVFFVFTATASEETVTPQKYKAPTRINKVTRIISEANRGYCERVNALFFVFFSWKPKIPFGFTCSSRPSSYIFCSIQNTIPAPQLSLWFSVEGPNLSRLRGEKP